MVTNVHSLPDSEVIVKEAAAIGFAKNPGKEMLRSLVMVEGKEAGTRWLLDRAPLSLGRATDNRVVLSGRQVSRHHAQIRWSGAQLVVDDLGSKNGTFVNGQAVGQGHPLRPGDLLQLAVGYTFSLVEAPADMPAEAPAKESTEGDRMPADRAEHERAPQPAAPRLRLDSASRQVWVLGNEVAPPLSPAQFALLHLLHSKENQVVSRDEIVTTVWGEDAEKGVSEEAIDALVRRLRRRIAKLDPNHAYIVTVRGHGFRLAR